MRQRFPGLTFLTMDARRQLSISCPAVRFGFKLCLNMIRRCQPHTRNMSDFDDGHFAAAVDKGATYKRKHLHMICISAAKGLSDCLGTVTARQEYFQDTA